MQLQEILDFLTPEHFRGDAKTHITDVKSIDDATFGAHTIGWCSDKNKQLLAELKQGTVLVSTETYTTQEGALNAGVNCIAVENPRRAFATLLTEFFVPKPVWSQIEPSATIHPGVQMPEHVSIGAHVVIEADCQLGDYVHIDHNTVIKSGTILGAHVRIGANCTIGGVGFGYEMNESGTYEVIPHIGHVELHAHVEVGNNVCIDRAVLGATELHEHVKVDNLVHIAHGVTIGKNSLVIAHAMVAGSVKIGENAWISPASSIRQKLNIGNNTVVGMGSVVVKDVEDNTTVAGVPAKKLESR
jgi:UDP-3-O-[3-hydroxymyristoyl] glucosamine N-acyltransferase